MHYRLCKTGKIGCDVTCTHQYLTEEEVKAQLGWHTPTLISELKEGDGK